MILLDDEQMQGIAMHKKIQDTFYLSSQKRDPCTYRRAFLTYKLCLKPSVKGWNPNYISR